MLVLGDSEESGFICSLLEAYSALDEDVKVLFALCKKRIKSFRDLMFWKSLRGIPWGLRSQALLNETETMSRSLLVCSFFR